MNMGKFGEIQRLEELPPPALFASQFESKNVPVVFNGCAKDWKAFTRWNPANGGLHYLQERVGSSIVEAMLSESAPVFYGDIRSHERVPLPFSTFIGFCKQRRQNIYDSHGPSEGSERHQPVVSDAEQDMLLSSDAQQQIYLAQVPIMNIEDKERVQLEILRDDIQIPPFLDMKKIVSINLWMSNSQSRSSTHYDPHHNVLCIIAGCKKVVLWPPSASPMLYPMPIYGEASNHSSIPLENPNFSLYPRAHESMEYSQEVVLRAGDALFIPEGWFHQVDSDDLTIAVNFWWQSNIMCSMSEHMDAYYLRRILRRLTDSEMNFILQKGLSGMEEMKRHAHKLHDNREADSSYCDLDHVSKRQDLQGNHQQLRVKLDELEPSALRALHELVSLVHDRVSIINPTQTLQLTSATDSALCATNTHKRSVTTNISLLEDDPVAEILWNLDPQTLQSVLLAMAHNFPRTLEALTLHLLSPVGAEVLTRKFDEMDKQTHEEDRKTFYQVFYGAFGDQSAAMDAILNGKELFALQVEYKYLGSMSIRYLSCIILSEAELIMKNN